MSSSNGVSKDAFANSGTANDLSRNYNARATQAYNILTPTLNRMVTNPQGFAPQTMNNMTTAAMQTAGGGNAATVGGGLQRAVATNNAGAFNPAAAQSGHDAMTTLSDAALQVQNRNAMLQEQQREMGIQGEEGMYSGNVGAGENALGLSNQALGVANQGKQTKWSQWMQPWQILSQNAATAAQAGG